jgi:hypothetical protein
MVPFTFSCFIVGLGLAVYYLSNQSSLLIALSTHTRMYSLSVSASTIYFLREEMHKKLTHALEN